MAALTDSLIETAMRVAATAHRHQCRKASRLPYLTHPASVALILGRAGISDPELIAAALLHDVLEDTDWTVERLSEVFPDRVIAVVRESSESKTDAAGEQRPWRDRKLDHIERLKSASRAACLVVLADKLHNLFSMVTDLEQGQPLWDRFNADRADVMWYHREIVAAAERGNDAPLAAISSECRALISRLESA